MTVEDIEARLKEIEEAVAKRGGIETSHRLQDELYEDVLEAISEPETPYHCLEPVAMLARTALKARDIKFTRYYA